MGGGCSPFQEGSTGIFCCSCKLGQVAGCFCWTEGWFETPDRGDGGWEATHKYLLLHVTVQALSLPQVPPPWVPTALPKPPAPAGCHRWHYREHLQTKPFTVDLEADPQGLGLVCWGKQRRNESKAGDNMNHRDTLNSPRSSESARLWQMKRSPLVWYYFHAGKHLQWPLMCERSVTSVLRYAPDSPAQRLLSAGDLCAVSKRNLMSTHRGTERGFCSKMRKTHIRFYFSILIFL